MSNDYLKYLLEQYAANASTPQETVELFEWIKKSKDDALLKQKVQELWSAHENDKQLPEVNWDAIYRKIIKTPIIGQRNVWLRVAAAAIVIALLSVGGYFMFNKKPSTQTIAAAEEKQLKNDLVPGGN